VEGLERQPGPHPNRGRQVQARSRAGVSRYEENSSIFLGTIESPGLALTVTLIHQSCGHSVNKN
jgi:hypothetical protein